MSFLEAQQVISKEAGEPETSAWASCGSRMAVMGFSSAWNEPGSTGTPTARQGGGLGDGRDYSSLPLSFSDLRAGQEVTGFPVSVCPVISQLCRERGPFPGWERRPEKKVAQVLGVEPGCSVSLAVCVHTCDPGTHELKAPENSTLETGPEVW